MSYSKISNKIIIFTEQKGGINFIKPYLEKQSAFSYEFVEIKNIATQNILNYIDKFKFFMLNLCGREKEIEIITKIRTQNKKCILYIDSWIEIKNRLHRIKYLNEFVNGIFVIDGSVKDYLESLNIDKKLIKVIGFPFKNNYLPFHVNPKRNITNTIDLNIGLLSQPVKENCSIKYINEYDLLDRICEVYPNNEKIIFHHPSDERSKYDSFLKFNCKIYEPSRNINNLDIIYGNFSTEFANFAYWGFKCISLYSGSDLSTIKFLQNYTLYKEKLTQIKVHNYLEDLQNRDLKKNIADYAKFNSEIKRLFI